MTTLGSLAVFFIRSENETLRKIIIGSSAGVMISASIWSLLIPSLENDYSLFWLPGILGIILGALFIITIDKIGNKKLFLAVTLHNVPEGLAVGLAFSIGLNNSEMMPLALGLAMGIGLQNFPEGMAIALPYKLESNAKKGFLYGTLSGIVEPIAAIFALFVFSNIGVYMPWLLSFSAGMMIYVSVNELIPSVKGKLAAFSFIMGFAIMMMFDILL